MSEPLPPPHVRPSPPPPRPPPAASSSNGHATSGPYAQRFALLSRRRADAAPGVKPQQRYDPAAVLARRTQAIRTSAPPTFKRRVVRTDPFAPPPMQQWHNEQAENRWQPVSAYESRHNEARYKSKQCLFSAPEPITADPLLRWLESRWLDPDLHGSDHNDELTRTKRCFFDAAHHASHSAAAIPSGFDQASMDARLMLEDGQRAKTARSSTQGHSHTSRTRSRVTPKQRRDIAAAIERSSTPQFLASLSDASDLTAPSARRDTELDPFQPDAHSHTHAPQISATYDPQSAFFRHIPNRDPLEVAADRKREREWNERHQLAHHVEGW